MKVGDGEVFINVPRLFVGKMPLGEPPTRATRQDKLGPRREQVANHYASRSPSLELTQPELLARE